MSAAATTTTAAPEAAAAAPEATAAAPEAATAAPEAATATATAAATSEAAEPSLIVLALVLHRYQLTCFELINIQLLKFLFEIVHDSTSVNEIRLECDA